MTELVDIIRKQKIQRQNRSPFSLIYFIIFSVRSYTKNITVNYVPWLEYNFLTRLTHQIIKYR